MGMQPSPSAILENASMLARSAEPQSFVPDADNSRAYRNALGQFATGVTIVTTAGEIGPVGITANSFSSVSLDPALVLWSMSKKSERYGSFATASDFAIHVLSENQHDLAMAFAKDAQSFSSCSWHAGTTGVPLIMNALACFECNKQSVHDAGDHVIIVGAVKRVTMGDGEPLVFAGGNFGSFRTGA